MTVQRVVKERVVEDVTHTVTLTKKEAAIHTYGNPRSTYRVKWYPSEA